MYLELQNQTEKKLTVLLDGEFYCKCYPKDLSVIGLKEGADEMDEHQLLCLNQTVLLPRAKKRSLALLGKMQYTCSALQKKLTNDGYPAKVIELTLDYLKGYHYLDDNGFANDYARVLLTKYSEREIMQKMLLKGFDKNQIETAIRVARESYADEENDSDKEGKPEYLAIRSILSKKGYNAEDADETVKKKMVMALYRKGFSLSDIYAVMNVSEC